MIKCSSISIHSNIDILKHIDTVTVSCAFLSSQLSIHSNIKKHIGAVSCAFLSSQRHSMLSYKTLYIHVARSSNWLLFTSGNACLSNKCCIRNRWHTLSLTCACIVHTQSQSRWQRASLLLVMGPISDIHDRFLNLNLFLLTRTPHHGTQTWARTAVPALLEERSGASVCTPVSTWKRKQVRASAHALVGAKQDEKCGNF